MSQSTTAIKAIDTQSIHRITSGQVVIDLQTAVKELVENSLDAGATSIEVRFKEYGVESIEIIDNGSGIASGDYEAVALKHHTSKLESFEDLSSVMTFGFRGEALSSLCALCDSVTVCTATSTEAPIGTVLEFDRAGKLVSKSGKVARQPGTTVAVTGLFKPLPVRRKELERNAKREFGKALNLLNAYALVPCAKENKGVRLTCSNTIKGRKTVQLRTDGTPSSRSSLSALWGPKALENIVDLDLEFDVEAEKSVLRRQGVLDKGASRSIRVRVSGLTSKFVVGGGRSGTDRQFFFVNGRPCLPSKVQKAFNEVYRTFNATQSPFVVADFIVPTDSLDINVSPDKRTVFIHSENSLIQALKTALEEKFSSSRATYDLSTQITAKPASPSEAPSNRKPLFLEEDAQEDDPVVAITPKTVVEPQDEGFGEPALLKQSPTSLASPADDDDVHVVIPEDSEAPLDAPNAAVPPDPPMSPTATQMRIDHPIHSPPPEPSPRPSSKPRPVFPPARSSHSSTSRAPTSTRRDKGVQMVLSTQNTSWNLRRSAADSDSDRPRKKQKRSEGSSRSVVPSTSQQGLLKTLAEFARTGSQVTFGKTAEEREEEGVSSDDLDEEERENLGSGASNDDEDDLESDVHDETMLNVSLVSEPDIVEEDDEADVLAEDMMSVCEDAPATSPSHTPGPPDFLLDTSLSQVDASEGAEGVDATSISSPGTPSSQEVVRTVDEDGISMRFNLDGITASWQSLGERLTALRAAPAVVERMSEEQAVLTRDAGLKSTEEDGKASEVLSRVLDKADFLTMQVVGQFNKGFVITRLRKDSDGNLDHPKEHRGLSVIDDLFIVDQHAADEKYNFERLQATTRIEAQKLYRPLPLELTAADELVAVENMDVLRENGFEVAVSADESVDGGRHLSLVAQPISKNTVFDMKDLEELIHLMHDQPRGSDGQMLQSSKYVRYASVPV
ncbi:hypothetical protein EIP91_006832 [Steccherinum ochraceum]|uniref:DNA mismatch repair protein PMS1 n=1 Tax=Steccherinum ochraceum TaxID=92696 RepID=A0A4R0R580_9APHY|nr:hypothetical protein EIP91_006832 [Steccherinum ochraceum]